MVLRNSEIVVPQEIAQSRFLFVRHGLSNGNLQYAARGTDSWFDETLYDAELSDKGVEQCEQSITKQLLSKVDLTHCLVSPLRRAQSTAYYLLKDHP